jgi:hypothetical protein
MLLKVSLKKNLASGFFGKKNCDIIKLRGHPESSYLPSQGRKTLDGQGNDLGYGKNDKRLDNPQPSPKPFYK